MTSFLAIKSGNHRLDGKIGQTNGFAKAIFEDEIKHIVTGGCRVDSDHIEQYPTAARRQPLY